MNNRNISRQIQRLRDLIKKTDEATAGNLELQAHWARYLCVLSSGLLENALVETYSSYVTSKAIPQIAGFASAALSIIQNPKTQKFLEVAGRFDANWRDELELFVAADGRKEAIDSIIANRHLIAHGVDSGITLARLKEYLNRSIEVLEFIEVQCSR